VPLSWLRELVALPAGQTGRSVYSRLVRVGLEVETVEQAGAEIAGPVVVGEVRSIEELTGFKKPIRYCSVAVGEPEPRGIVCGATNFAVGDRVVVALPGAVLPGGFAISARSTYGHTSDGMICSARELGVGDDSRGILVLPGGPAVGADAVALLGLRDEVLDIAVTPDRGYCLSMRGIGRETAAAYDLAYDDPAAEAGSPGVGKDPVPAGWPVRLDDPSGCGRFVALTVSGVDPNAVSPVDMQRRLLLAGMRPVSLVVDVTNYVLLELGQPLHAYDRDRLTGPIVVRRACAGEHLSTLDGTRRALDPADLLITDDSGPIGLAGVMGGASSAIGPQTRDVVLEAAHFDPVAVARMVRRHKLPSEAARRFERGVDPELAPVAARRAAQLLAELGGGVPGEATDVGTPPPLRRIALRTSLVSAIAGRPVPAEAVVRRLQQVGCSSTPDGAAPGSGVLSVMVPSWRPDLSEPADLTEEVLRLEGYDTIPSVLPPTAPGRGLTRSQHLRRRIGTALADAGYVEVAGSPFVSPVVHDAFGLDPDDPRRTALRLANPLSEEEPELRTSLLPGLLAVLARNVARGLRDLALSESGLVYLPRPGAPGAPAPGVDRRPTEDELAALYAAVPDQPRHLAVVLAGERTGPGVSAADGAWNPVPRPATWADATAAAGIVAEVCGRTLRPVPAARAPWHPGRCAALEFDGQVVGHAGELHPRTLAALGLPARTCAMELDLSRLLDDAPPPVAAPRISTFPPATSDVALVVADAVPAGDVEDALRAGAGELLESLRLFDVYTGEQVGAGRRSLAYALRLRAPDRTLTAEEAGAVRDAAVAEAGRRTGAVLRS